MESNFGSYEPGATKTKDNFKKQVSGIRSSDGRLREEIIDRNGAIFKLSE